MDVSRACRENVWSFERQERFLQYLKELPDNRIPHRNRREWIEVGSFYNASFYSHYSYVVI